MKVCIYLLLAFNTLALPTNILTNLLKCSSNCALQEAAEKALEAQSSAAAWAVEHAWQESQKSTTRKLQEQMKKLEMKAQFMTADDQDHLYFVKNGKIEKRLKAFHDLTMKDISRRFDDEWDFSLVAGTHH